MTHEPAERDATLGRALRDVAADPGQAADWPGLRRAITRHATPELARRRARHRRMRIVIPAALAASAALLLLVSRAPGPAGGSAPVDGLAAVTAGPITIDELLDANVSDGQFRALLFGATEADDLLLIAAEDDVQ
jgi:hypothetical protein